ncbi:MULTISPECIES: phosphate ABC transporter ATP-binding protein PstB [Leuconostoc]|jgi:phosphate transport system ATP-binding protein|uniref:Phosphate ABC transporter ATP-binding protein n=1 Tax=Leuconostoc pseudomesenteroides TaxID=33968 RepID=A0A5B8SYF1_LEUPS|nr:MULTISPECIES: phosphate ABC transporter ATP-binding protein PstB [Leuconostoc]MBS0957162.1 phosphate ABC transporter ATP-binding protein [Leuconostoc pseudomesenteroides]MCC7668495.1 phosphate ABC transporter ATP-binding protein [Leuconostoc pseudomesenteroides]MCC8438933.1 phosphate ABC transporter ATP-binding protein [Leuconostoc pseudomesenteroides]MCT4381109.1 phosphate ABC transporter ATP-binding protein [Leuconostoc pseudomesenteroides]MCT4412278.1 phosphate ABC transporter ATP-bindin
MTDKQEKTILSTRDVRLWYGQKEALHGIDLDFPNKGITALIGPSGSGKTTYLRALNRMHDLEDGVTVTGSFNFNGTDIYAPTTDTVDLRKRIGMVFQQPNPFPFSIYENVIFGLRLDGVKDKAVLDEAVERSLKQASVWDEVKDDLHKSALGLSGGQQQRVSIARVLAMSPELLLLDEPTSALDPISSRNIEETLLKLREDYAMIIVTHSMSQASRISDRTAFFLSGDLIEVDQTKHIFLNPQKQETQDYVSGRFG